MLIISVFGVLHGTKCRVPAHHAYNVHVFLLIQCTNRKRKQDTTRFDVIILTLMITENFPIPLSILYHIPVEKSESERILERLETSSGEPHISVLTKDIY